VSKSNFEHEEETVARSNLIDGAFANRLREIEACIIELTERLFESEEGASYGSGHDEPPLVGRKGTQTGGVEDRMMPRGHLNDSEVKRYRRLKKTWAFKMTKLINELEKDLNEE